MRGSVGLMGLPTSRASRLWSDSMAIRNDGSCNPYSLRSAGVGCSTRRLFNSSSFPRRVFTSIESARVLIGVSIVQMFSFFVTRVRRLSCNCRFQESTSNMLLRKIRGLRRLSMSMERLSSRLRSTTWILVLSNESR